MVFAVIGGCVAGLLGGWVFQKRENTTEAVSGTQIPDAQPV